LGTAIVAEYFFSPAEGQVSLSRREQLGDVEPGRAQLCCGAHATAIDVRARSCRSSKATAWSARRRSLGFDWHDEAGYTADGVNRLIGQMLAERLLMTEKGGRPGRFSLSIRCIGTVTFPLRARRAADALHLKSALAFVSLPLWRGRWRGSSVHIDLNRHGESSVE
jgi:hypothetical protein